MKYPLKVPSRLSQSLNQYTDQLPSQESQAAHRTDKQGQVADIE
jgi:hypothetical protein